MILTNDRVTIPERLLRPYMEWMHGRKTAAHQFDFYRCRGCRRLLNWKRLRTGGCDCDGDRRLSPARLTVMEKLRVLVAPWTI